MNEHHHRQRKPFSFVDWAATQAMKVLLAQTGQEVDPDELAQESYVLGEAMGRERQRLWEARHALLNQIANPKSKIENP